MKKAQFLKLLSKKHSGIISETESKQLEAAITGNEVFNQIAEKMQQYLSASSVPGAQQSELDATWRLIAHSEQSEGNQKYTFTPGRSRMTHLFLKIASVIILLTGIGAGAYYFLHQGGGNVTFTAADQPAFLLMADGTKIWLNKHSSILYNKEFSKKERQITLQGEAYFDVAKNKAIPLFIHARNINIEVKGTAFNVKAYSQNKNIEIALERGLIEVTNALDDHKMILLHPNQNLVVAGEAASGKQQFFVESLQPGHLLAATSWTTDTLIFKKEKLKELALRMEKKYHYKIEIQGTKLEEKRFSGVFINETITQALDALKLSYPLNYSISNKVITIKEQP